MMQLIEFILDFDKHLLEIVKHYGTATYGFLFVIVFAETGLVFLPFLPGDSLLFAAGAIAAADHLNVHLLALLLMIAAILGDTVNYQLGRWIGPKMPLLKKSHIEKTEAYFAKYGSKTIVLARFIPIVRTFAPFVAGMGAMPYRTFALWNVIGGAIWVLAFLYAGYWFGSWPWVKSNFKIVVVAIIGISVLPMVWDVGRHFWLARRASKAN